MQYTTRIGDRPMQAHINYQCPCGCVAGLTYDSESGSEHLGACCCGRLLWAGSDAEARVRAAFEAGIAYEIDAGAVTLPWGDKVATALAVPVATLPVIPSARVRDVVCGMMIDPATAAATSQYRGETYYFCAAVCKQRFDAEPERYLTA